MLDLDLRLVLQQVKNSGIISEAIFVYSKPTFGCHALFCMIFDILNILTYSLQVTDTEGN